MRISLSMLVLLSFFIISGTACANQGPKLEDGRCRTNTDCGDGQLCKNTFCEDIYFPRKEIKPY